VMTAADVDGPLVVRERLEAFASEVLAGAVNRPVQRVNAGLYLRGLIEEGARKSRAPPGPDPTSSPPETAAGAHSQPHHPAGRRNGRQSAGGLRPYEQEVTGCSVASHVSRLSKPQYSLSRAGSDAAGLVYTVGPLAPRSTMVSGALVTTG